jgi:hypothetical protein
MRKVDNEERFLRGFRQKKGDLSLTFENFVLDRPIDYLLFTDSQPSSPNPIQQNDNLSAVPLLQNMCAQHQIELKKGAKSERTVS